MVNWFPCRAVEINSRIQVVSRLVEINNSKFKDLPKKSQNYFKNRDFKVIIADETDIKIKQDIFNRINTGSLPLNDSEIRKGSYSGAFYDMVLELKGNNEFKAICPIPEMKEKRGEYEELILRFFAYVDRYQEFKHDVAIFLNDYLDEKNKTDFDKELYLKVFRDMVYFITDKFPMGFRKDENANSTPRVRFEAIAVGVHLALQENPSLKEPNMDWLESKGFKKQTTSDASNNPNRLKNRIEFVRDGLLGRLSEDRLLNG